MWSVISIYGKLYGCRSIGASQCNWLKDIFRLLLKDSFEVQLHKRAHFQSFQATQQSGFIHIPSINTPGYYSIHFV